MCILKAVLLFLKKSFKKIGQARIWLFIVVICRWPVTNVFL